MKEAPPYFNEAQRKMLSILEWKEWGPKMKQLYRKEKQDWSQYSIVFGEQHQKGLLKGIRKGRAEGFMDGMKAMAKKMLELGEPLEKVVSLTGLSEAELLK